MPAIEANDGEQQQANDEPDRAGNAHYGSIGLRGAHCRARRPCGDEAP